MSFWPSIHEYFKTNYFTAILALVLASPFFIGYLRRGGHTVVSARKAVLLLFVVCLAGTVLRFGWVTVSHYAPAFHWNDAERKSFNLTENDGIHIYAVSISEGVWFRDAEGKPLAKRPIGYPVMLGAVYSIFGASLPVFYCFDLML